MRVSSFAPARNSNQKYRFRSRRTVMNIANKTVLITSANRASVERSSTRHSEGGGGFMRAVPDVVRDGVDAAGAHPLPEDPDHQPHPDAPARHRSVERDHQEKSWLGPPNCR